MLGGGQIVEISDEN